MTKRLKDYLHGDQRGFTFVEIAIIAPIVILTIGAFITVVVSMTGDVLISRATTQLQYNVQDALNRIDQDVKQSSTFLAETNVPLTSPQGYGDDTTVFDNVDSTKGTMLVLNTLATTGNPLASTSSIAYLNNSPNACGTLQGQNTPMSLNVVYFIKNNTLWRRTIMPSNYPTGACNNTGTGTAAPWQQPSCTTVGGFCKTLDEDLVDGVSTSGFTIQYFNSSSTTTENTTASASPSCNTTGCVATRNSALLSATTVNVTIDAHQTIAAKDVEQLISLQSTRSDVNATAIATVPAPSIPSVPVVTGKPNTSGIVGTSTSTGQPTFTWSPSTGGGTISYSLQYRVNGGSWSSSVTIPASGTPSYTIPTTQFGKTIDVQVQASNIAGTSAWSTASTVVVPVYATPQLQNSWQNWTGTGFSTAAFSETSDGIVSLKGLIANGTSTAGTVMFTLPAGFRPVDRMIFPVDSYNGSVDTAGRIDIDTDGTVTFQIGTSAYLSLDGINFLASGNPYTYSSLTLAGAWANFGSTFSTAQYTIDAIGRVHLKGMVKSGSGTIVATTPAAIVPANNMYISSNSNNAFGDYVLGTATIAPVAYNNAWVTLQAMYYPGAAGSWTAMSLSSWSNYGAPFGNAQYTKSSDGFVTLRGFIKGGALNTTLATLPAGYRPSAEMVFQTASWDAFSRVDVKPTGAISVVVSSNTGWLSLNNISYLAEQ